jgi:hypothetical protein
MDYVAYFMLGFGIGMSFYYMFYSNNSMTQLDRKKHDLDVRKEWFAMLAERNKEIAKTTAWKEKLGVRK